MPTNSILIVEDNKKLANYLKSSLLEKGYNVDIESSGARAVFRITRENPDVVILDIMLPEMDGRQVCQTVRDRYLGKILMLTALGDIKDEVIGLNLGADDYLSKPIDTELLHARVAAVLRRPALKAVTTELNIGQLHINMITQEVSFKDEKILLKPSEFELLLLLAKNSNLLLSRDNINYALRGREYDGVDRSIDLTISNLRKKLGDNEKPPARIKTIYNKGYILVSDAWD